MNDNYLKYLLSTASPYGRFNDPFEMSFEMDYENVIERLKELLKEDDISFLKKDGIKPMEFIKKRETISLNLESFTDEEMEYFRQRLFESLRVPQRYFDNTDPIYFDEYH